MYDEVHSDTSAQQDSGRLVQPFHRSTVLFDCPSVEHISPWWPIAYPIFTLGQASVLDTSGASAQPPPTGTVPGIIPPGAELRYVAF